VRLNAFNVLEMPGLASLDQVRKETMMKRFQEILDRPSSTTFSRANQLD
jgi:hypothetical protein